MVAQVTQADSTDLKNAPVVSSFLSLQSERLFDAGRKIEGEAPREDTKEAATTASNTPSAVSQIHPSIYQRN